MIICAGMACRWPYISYETGAPSYGDGFESPFAVAQGKRITLRRKSGPASDFSLPRRTKSARHPVPAECKALLGETLRQLFAFFACPSYPCSGFPEPIGAETTHRPFGSRNSSPMT
jgi:hypothetical protein